MTPTIEEVTQHASDFCDRVQQLFDKSEVDKKLRFIGVADQFEANFSRMTDEFIQLVINTVVNHSDNYKQGVYLIDVWQIGICHIETQVFFREIIRDDSSSRNGIFSSMPSFTTSLGKFEVAVKTSMQKLAVALFTAARDEGSKEGVYDVLAPLRPVEANERFADLAAKNSRDDLTDQETAELDVLRDFFDRLQAIVDAALITVYTPSP